MQVIKKFGYEINQDTFDKNGMLNRYIENFIYSSLLKKKKYGISNNALYEIINKIDNCINQDQINQLLDYFSSARIRKIKESGEDTVKDVVNCVTINGSMINSQVATQGSTIDSTVLGNQTVSHDSELLSKIIAAQSELPKFYNQLKPDQYQKIQKNLLALHRDISDHKLTERKKWNIRKYLETLSDLAGIGGFLMAVVKML